MPHRQPDILEQIIEALKLLGIPLWAYFLALGGALVHNARKIKEGHRFSIKEFVADTIICLSIGFITYYVCKAQGLSYEMTVVAISLSSGMGNKYYDKVEDIIGGVLTKWLTATKK